MKNWIVASWHKYNPFDIKYYWSMIADDVQDIKNGMNILDDKIGAEIKLLEAQLNYHKELVVAVGETIPDMLWLKDVNGKYMYANNAIKCGLLFDSDPIGKNDVEIAMKAKKTFGPENHTFGEVCGNSDKTILETLKPQRFFEYGKVKGNMLYLEVHKAPFYVNDELVGVCGTGRDLTPYVEEYRNNGTAQCETCPMIRSDLFDMFKFANPDEG
jgi:hypothetical protein